jgi:cytochrome d ubiquinol oxidase subunit I
MTAEVGRQPWIVQGLLMVSNGTSPSVSATDVTISIFGILFVYALLFFLWLYGLAREIRRGPEPGAAAVAAPAAASAAATSSDAPAKGK